jgi:hypothetical protein
MPDADPADLPPTPREKLSKTPSWIMVGFVVGCVFAYAVDQEIERRRSTPAPLSRPDPTPAHSVPAPPRTPAAHLSLHEIEAIFEKFADRAVWENDLTQVAVWNPQAQKFSDFVEVVRSGEYFAYRTLTRLTRPLISNEPEAGVLMLFTETDAQRAKRLEQIPPIFRPAPPTLPP